MVGRQELWKGTKCASHAVAADASPAVGILYAAWFLADFYAANGLADLSPFLEDAEELDWTGIHPYYRSSASLHNKTLGIPFAGEAPIMSYRSDVMERLNLTVPGGHLAACSGHLPLCLPCLICSV